MPDRDVSQPYVENGHVDPGVHRGHAEDEPDIDGYDETQRAEIAEVEGDGPNDGIVMTDLAEDLGEDLDDDDVEDQADTLGTILDADGNPI